MEQVQNRDSQIQDLQERMNQVQSSASQAQQAAEATLCGSSSVAGPNALGANNASKNGGGIGANARWSFDNKHLDFGLHAFGGSGVGRYGTSGLPDVSIHADGTIDLIKSYQALGTLEWHATKLDVYMNAGAEYAGRAFDFDPTSGKFVGYGSPMFSNTGCFTEIAPTINNGFTLLLPAFQAARPTRAC